MKLEIIEKAWCINASNIEEPWFVDTDKIYYGTRGQAKSQALRDNDSCVLVDSGGMFPEDISYTTIKVYREKECDIVNYHGRHVKRYNIPSIEREVKIENLPDDKFFYVQYDRGYVGNSVQWWGLNGNGYTTNINEAQKYSGKGIKKRSWRDCDVIWDAEHVENNIKQHVDVQYLDRELKL